MYMEYVKSMYSIYKLRRGKVMSKYVVGNWIDGTCYYIVDYWFYSKNGANQVSHTIGTLENAIVFDSMTAQIMSMVLSMDMYLY